MSMTALVQMAAVTMAPDASWAASVAGDGTVRTWGPGVAPRVIRQAVAIEVGQPVAVALSGHRLTVIWAAEATIRRYDDLEGASPRDDVFQVSQAVSAVALSPSGRVAVVACADGTLRSLNPGTGEFGWTLATGPSAARAVALASDRGPVVAAFPDGSVRRYDLAAGTSDIVGLGRDIGLVAVTPDGRTVVAVGTDGVLLRWKPALTALPASLALGPAVTAVGVDGTGDRVLACMTDGQLWLHDFTGGSAIEFGAPAAPVGSVPSPAPELALPSEPGLRVVDNDVRFTVYRPQALAPGVWASLLVFAHKTDLVIEPGQPPVDPSKQVEAMARAYFGDAPVRSIGEDARSEVFRGARLRIAVDLPALRCNPGEAELDWWEPVHQVVFRLLAGPDLVGSVVRGAVRVWCGPLLLGEVSLAISVTASASGPPAPPVTESAQRYRKIFPSYSHDDQAIVAGFAEVVRALGDKYLQDVLALRSGERWQTRLPELIEEADVFQLFWSSNSMRSPYCRQEWEHALALGRPLFVRPLYWEDPMPQDPTMGLPPVALRELQFVKYNVHSAREDTPADTGEVSGVRPSPSVPASAGPAPAAPSGTRRKRRFMVTMAGAGATVFILAIAALTLLTPKSHPQAVALPVPRQTHSAAPSATPIGSPATGVAPLTRLLPADITDPAAQCSPYEPPYSWQMPGLIQALACNDPGLPNGEVYAFQMESSASFQLSWDNFNSWWGFDLSQAGGNCPPAGSNRQGAHSFASENFPLRAGQVVECQAVSARSGGGSSAPAYAWALPSEDTFFVAQGADGSSFTALNSWWTNNSTPTSPRPLARGCGRRRRRWQLRRRRRRLGLGLGRPWPPGRAGRGRRSRLDGARRCSPRLRT
jgi:TIR domain